MSPRSRVILCLLYCLTRALFGAGFAVKTWDVDDGLPASSVFAIAQTSDGYLWFGTPHGLVRFDGFQFKVYEPGTTPGLNDSRIVTLFGDRSGALWIGTESGAIIRMQDGQFTPAPGIPMGSAERRLVGACEDSDGAIWLLNENKELWRYDGQQSLLFYVNVPQEGEALDDSRAGRSIIKSPGGQVRLATDKRQSALGLDRDAPGGVRFTHEFTGDIDALASSTDGGYWRLADSQVQYVGTNGSVATSFAYPWPRIVEARFIAVSAACEDIDGNLVVGTRGAGIFIVDRGGTNITNLSSTNGLSHDYVWSVFVDREGTLWVGTDGGGVKRVKQQTFSEVPGTHGWLARSIAEGSNGTVWIATRGDGVAKWTDGSLYKMRLMVEAPPFVDAIFVDRVDRVWLGTARVPGWQVALLRDGAFQQVAGAAGLPPLVHAIFQDRSGLLWFGTDRGVVRFDGREWVRFSTDQGLPAENVTGVAQDAGGHLWISMERGGLARMDGDQFVPVIPPGAAAPDVAALLIDKQGVFWMTTFANGLLRYHDGAWTSFTVADGLTSDDLTYLVEGPDESLWIGSNAGVLRVSRRQLNAIASGERGPLQCRAYTKADGLPTAECTFGSQPAAMRDSHGRLWFPTTKGVAVVDPAQLRRNTNPPPVVIQSVLVDNRDVALTNVLTLQPGDERVELRFVALNLRAPERALFRYKLEGHETAWAEAADRKVSYSRLPPGNYTFRVLACNEDGVWNEKGARLAIVVQPPIWRTWWFITAVVLAAIGSIAGAVHLVSVQRYQRELAVLRQQEALERERARIARDIHDQVGASLTQVALLGELVDADKTSPDDVASHALQICQTARETTRALDEIVWTVNPSNDTLEGLVNYICKYAQDYLGVAGLKYRLDVPSEVPPVDIAPDARHNVFLAAKEAITNIVRHSQATSAWLRIRLADASFIVEVEDNGRGLAGMDAQRAKTRHGLSNMRKRMEEIGGQFSLEPGAEGGALVRLTVPLNQQNVPRA